MQDFKAYCFQNDSVNPKLCYFRLQLSDLEIAAEIVGSELSCKHFWSLINSRLLIKLQKKSRPSRGGFRNTDKIASSRCSKDCSAVIKKAISKSCQRNAYYFSL